MRIFTNKKIVSLINDEYILLLLENKESFKVTKSLITKIFYLRGIEVIEFSSQISSIIKGFYYKEWKICATKNNLIHVVYSENAVKLQRNKLKSLVKGVKNQKISLLIQKLNFEIINWRQKYYLYSFKKDIPKLLDLYINKLIWRFVKKEHPRRPNTWIYNKYWKYIFGFWKFTAINKENGKIYILTSHEIYDSLINKKIFPQSLNVFDIKNLRTVFSINFNFFRNSFSGMTNIVYVKQKGLCYICKFPLKFKQKNFLITKSKIRKNQKFVSFKQIIFIHNLCKNLI